MLNKAEKIFTEQRVRELLEEYKILLLKRASHLGGYGEKERQIFLSTLIPELTGNIELPTEEEIENAKHNPERSTFQGTPFFAHERIAFDCGFRTGAKYILNLIKPSGK